MTTQSDTIDDSIFELDEEEVKVVICHPIPQISRPRTPAAAWYVDFAQEAVLEKRFRLDEDYCRQLLDRYCR